jgi:hypothetical protein
VALDAFTVAILGLVVLLLILIASMAQGSKPKLRFGQTPRDHGAEAWIEDHDIDQMIEARNERRRRRGVPEIGDELERDLRRSL